MHLLGAWTGALTTPAICKGGLDRSPAGSFDFPLYGRRLSDFQDRSGLDTADLPQWYFHQETDASMTRRLKVSVVHPGGVHLQNASNAWKGERPK